MSQHYSCLARVNEKHALPDVEVFYAARVTCDECDTPLDCTGFNAEDVVECGCGASVDQSAVERGWWYWYCLPGCMPEGDGDVYGPYESEDAAVAAVREDAGCDCDTCCGRDRYGYLMRDGAMLCPECSDEAGVHHCSPSGDGVDGYSGYRVSPGCEQGMSEWCILMAHDAEPGAACAHCGDVWTCADRDTSTAEVK